MVRLRRALLIACTASRPYVEFLRDQAVTHNFPDDCIDRFSGPATQSRGEILYDLWTTYGRSTPVDMDASSGSISIVAPPTPGEASRTIAMRVTAYDRPTGNVTISFAPACGATDHTLYAGPLASVSSVSTSCDP